MFRLNNAVSRRNCNVTKLLNKCLVRLVKNCAIRANTRSSHLHYSHNASKGIFREIQLQSYSFHNLLNRHSIAGLSVRLLVELHALPRHERHRAEPTGEGPLVGVHTPDVGL